jgi:hypothetical protein
LIRELRGLERRTARGTGKDSVDHGPGTSQHDDYANASAIAINRVIHQSRSVTDWTNEGLRKRSYWGSGPFGGSRSGYPIGDLDDDDDVADAEVVAFNKIGF